MHSPLPEQPPGHERTEQSLDVHPASHTHEKSTHEPCPEQPLGQSGMVQSTPP